MRIIVADVKLREIVRSTLMCYMDDTAADDLAKYIVGVCRHDMRKKGVLLYEQMKTVNENLSAIGSDIQQQCFDLIVQSAKLFNLYTEEEK